MPKHPPGVYPRGKSWSAVWDAPIGLDGKRRQATKGGFATASEAAAYRADQLRQRDTGQYLEPSKLSVADFLDRWLAECIQPSRTAGTLTTYGVALERHIKPVLGARPLLRLTPLDLQTYFRTKSESGRVDGQGGLSPSTLRQHWNILHQALQQGVRWGLLNRSPCDGCTPPQIPHLEAHCPPLEEANRLLMAVKDSWLYLPLLLLIHTGVRRGEALGLRWSDIELGRTTGVLNLRQQVLPYPTLRIAPHLKGKPRRVYLSGEGIAALHSRRTEWEGERRAASSFWAPHDLVFCRPDGQPRNPATFTSAVRRVALQIGLSISGPHAYRHLHATFLLNSGAPIHQIAKRLGHSPAQLLRTYAHVFVEDEEALAEVASGIRTGPLLAAREQNGK